MKTALYYVSTDGEWMEKVVEDFRWICRSGLFKKCNKIHIYLQSSLAEEWVKFFWGRIDDTNKVEIHVNENEEDEMIYVGTNLKS
jgi:hypothetical protein